MAKIDDVLTEVKLTNQAVADLKVRLYGEGQDPGDIPAMRKSLEKLNGRVFKNRTLAITAISIATGGGAGILKFLELW